MRPRSTSNETLSSATMPPKRTPTFCTRSKAPAPAAIRVLPPQEVLKISAGVYDVSAKAGREQRRPQGDSLDHAAAAPVDQPAARARGQAVRGVADRQPAPRQVARAPPLRRLLPSRARACGRTAGTRAQKRRPGPPP